MLSVRQFENLVSYVFQQANVSFSQAGKEQRKARTDQTRNSKLLENGTEIFRWVRNLLHNSHLKPYELASG